jgi:hypothetical protein
MKYTKMVCWLDNNEQKVLKVENKNYKEFEKNIDALTFNVFSLKKAKYKKHLI